MVNILKLWRSDHYYYKERLSFFMWYLYSSRIERLHPMNCGFWTVRRRNDRRASFPQEAFVPFWFNRTIVIAFRIMAYVKAVFPVRRSMAPEPAEEQNRRGFVRNNLEDEAGYY